METVTVDISEFGRSDAEELTDNLAEGVRGAAEFMGQDPELEVDVVCRDDEVYEIRWPGGPFDWAVRLTGGERIGNLELEGIRGGDIPLVEVKNRDVIVIRDD